MKYISLRLHAITSTDVDLKLLKEKNCKLYNN